MAASARAGFAGAYSLHAHSLDEAITRDIVRGRRPGEPLPDLLVCVTDAAHLRLNLRLVLEARALGLPPWCWCST